MYAQRICTKLYKSVYDQNYMLITSYSGGITIFSSQNTTGFHNGRVFRLWSSQKHTHMQEHNEDYHKGGLLR